MSESLKILAVADRFRSLATTLSDPRDVEVVRQYVHELEQRAWKGTARKPAGR